MSGGADIEANVGLDVDGGPVERAFDLIVSRMTEIQAQVDKITLKAREASEQFGGTGLKTLQDFNKVISTLERFQTTIQKNDPQFAKTQEIDKAWAAREAQQLASAEKVAAQESALWRKADQERYDRELAFMKEEEKLGEKMIAELNQQQLKAEAEVQRVREQNRLKLLRDQSEQLVKQTEGIKQLEALQVQSAARIAELRGVTRTGDPEQVRTALQLLAIEKQQLSTVTARIAEEQKAAVSPVANRVSGQMDTRAAKLDETSNLAGASLVQAQERALELETRIAVNTERAHAATEAERLEIEKMLVLDRERLSVADRQTASLQRQAAQQAKKDAEPSGGMMPSLLGKNGMMGVFAFSAAYGAAASVIYGIISTIKSGFEETIKFQDSLEKIGAIAGLTGKQMIDLGDTINGVAEHSKFARQEILDTAEALAKEGYNANEIQSSLAALNTLATTTGSTLTEVTGIATNMIGAFELSAQDMPRLANEMTVALNTTRLTSQALQSGIQSSGEIAKEANQSTEEFVGSLAAMAQAGLRGQQVGMGYRQVLMQLTTPSKTMTDELKRLGLTLDDINVKTLGLTGVINKLSDAGFTSVDAFKVFGARASAAFLALRDHQDITLKLAQAQNEASVAALANAKAMDSLSSQWQRFKNIASTDAGTIFGPITKGLKDMLQAMTEGADDTKLPELEANVRAAVVQFGLFSPQADAARKALFDYERETKAATDAVQKNTDAVGAAQTALKQANDEYDKEKNLLHEVDDALIHLSARKQVLIKDTNALAAETINLENQFSGLAAQLQGTTLSYDNLTKAMLRYRQMQLSVAQNAAVTVAANANNTVNASAGAASRDLHNIHNSSGWSQLPDEIRQSLQMMQHPEQFARSGTPTSFIRSNAAAAVNDWLSKNPNLAPGMSQYMHDFVGQVGTLGTGISTRSTMTETANKLGALGTKPFLDFSTKVQATQDPKQLKALAQEALNNQRAAKDPATAGAWGDEANDLLQRASVFAPPEPKNTPKAKKTHSLENRQASAEDAEALKADKYGLKDQLDQLFGKHNGDIDPEAITITGPAPPLTVERFQKNLANVNTALEKVVADRTKQFTDELKRLKIDPNSTRGQNMLRDLNEELDGIRGQAKDKISKDIVSHLKDSVDKIEKFYKDLQTGIDDQYDMVAARATALTRTRYTQNGAGVPDYVTQTVQRQISQAADIKDQQTVKNNEAELAKLNEVLVRYLQLTDAAQKAKLLSDTDPALKSLTELHDKIDTLNKDTNKLKATLQNGLIPTSFNDKLKMAIENYKQVNHLTASFTDMVGADLTNALSTAQGAFQSFFSDIISGNASVDQSFGNMARAAIGYLTQLLAKMLAVKLMDAALNLFGSSWSGMTSAGISQGTDFSNLGAGTDFGTTWSGAGMNFQPHLHGGIMHALTGRYVTDGVSDRDSVPAMIAKGEYVVQKSAVDSVGVGFMEKLNRSGANALGALGPHIVLPPPAHQQMSVFIVPPDQKPQMGPNDVLVTIADDIWRGGPTKQLIKQVAQGA